MSPMFCRIYVLTQQHRNQKIKTISNAFHAKYTTTYLYGVGYAMQHNVNLQTLVGYFELFKNILSVWVNTGT